MTGKNSDSLAPSAWRDIVAIVDDGRQSATDYEPLARLATKLEEEYPRGYGLLIIIPKNARPPSDHARRAINDVLEAASRGLKCVCWLVEGRGFQAAMARAVLTGLQLFPRSGFATSVQSDLSQALAWILSCIRGSSLNLDEEVASAHAHFLRRRPSR